MILRLGSSQWDKIGQSTLDTQKLLQTADKKRPLWLARPSPQCNPSSRLAALSSHNEAISTSSDKIKTSWYQSQLLRVGKFNYQYGPYTQQQTSKTFFLPFFPQGFQGKLHPTTDVGPGHTGVRQTPNRSTGWAKRQQRGRLRSSP